MRFNLVESWSPRVTFIIQITVDLYAQINRIHKIMQLISMKLDGHQAASV